MYSDLYVGSKDILQIDKMAPEKIGSGKKGNSKVLLQLGFTFKCDSYPFLVSYRKRNFLNVG